MNIDTRTGLNLVIGHPIQHSLSPKLHNALYQALGLNYVLVAIDKPDITTLIQSIKSLSIRLTAVTLPYKTQVIDYADTISPEVIACKAANTLILKNNLVHAYNTDITGIEYALRDVRLSEKKALIMGAGGAARAVAYVLSTHHAEIYICNRTHGTAEQLAKEFNAEAIELNSITDKPFDIIINTTPLGLASNNINPLSGYPFKKSQTVFDLIYGHAPTPFLIDAKNAGATVIDGSSMFIAQAIKQIELLTESVIDPSHLDAFIESAMGVEA